MSTRTIKTTTGPRSHSTAICWRSWKHCTGKSPPAARLERLVRGHGAGEFTHLIEADGRRRTALLSAREPFPQHVKYERTTSSKLHAANCQVVGSRQGGSGQSAHTEALARAAGSLGRNRAGVLGRVGCPSTSVQASLSSSTLTRQTPYAAHDAAVGPPGGADHRVADERHISDHVQDLVPHELIVEGAGRCSECQCRR